MEHYAKTCAKDNLGKNIEYFEKKKGFPQDQAVAASFSALKKACGVKSKKKMKVSSIVGELRTLGLQLSDLMEGYTASDEDLALANNPGTPPDKLSELHNKHVINVGNDTEPAHEGISTALAQNPNTPLDLLYGYYAYKHPKLVNENPVGALTTMEDPNFFNKVQGGALRSLLHADNAPDYLLKAAARTNLPGVHHSLVQHPNVPDEILKSVSMNPETVGYFSGDIQNRALFHPNVSMETVHNFIKGPHTRLLPSSDFNYKFIKNDVLEKHPFIPHLFSDIYDSETGKYGYTQRERMAYNPHLTQDQINLLAQDPKNYVRHGIAKNPSITKEAWERLVNDPDRSVQLAAKKNKPKIRKRTKNVT